MQLITRKRAYKLKEVAALLGVSYHTIYRAACRGDIQVIKGLIDSRVSDTELDRFINATRPHGEAN